jgi:UDP-N-acetylglucosamine 1-carboxyvinyltransferase
MDRIRIIGGKRLEGEVEISGSKNASLPLMAATLLTEGPCRLDRIPRLADITTMAHMLEFIGADVKRGEDGVLTIHAQNLQVTEAPYDLMRKMRASIYVMGPLLARFGQAKVSLPGGCAIGTRPVDLHLRGFEALGAQIELHHGYIQATAPAGGLRGAECVLSGPSGPSVGATCNVLMAAVLAQGHSTLRDIAREPHVEDLIHCLNGMGAHIESNGCDVLEVDGVDALHGVEHSVIPDQIEAATFMIAAALTQGDVVLRDCRPHHMRAEIAKLHEMGAQAEVLANGHDLRVWRDAPFRPAAVRTAPYPGFPTDAQAQFMVAMSLAQGESVVVETIFPDRFMHAAELNRMGADIRVLNGTATIHGVERLSGAAVMCSDLRASAALVLAGLVAQGETECLRVYHIDRGYERIEAKLRGLGAYIERLSATDPSEMSQPQGNVPVS